MTARAIFFPSSLRIVKKEDFDAVYASSACSMVKGVSVHTKPNALDHSRLGLSISKQAGNAVVRNSLKRKIREAFRQLQHSLPIGYDIVVTMHQDNKMTKSQFEQLLASTLEEHEQKWKK